MALTLKIIRGNEEFILDQELNYDFNFQDARIIKGTLKPVSCDDNSIQMLYTYYIYMNLKIAEEDLLVETS